MAEQGDTILQFVPFVSRLETGFWHELGRRKLEKYKLSEEQQDIHGCYYNSESGGRLRAVASWCAHARKVSLATRSLRLEGCSINITAMVFTSHTHVIVAYRHSASHSHFYM